MTISNIPQLSKRMLTDQYYRGPNVASMTQRKRYRTTEKVLPGVFTGLLGAFQLLLWIAIIILEIISVYYDAGRGTVYAGFWCSIIFSLTWVSMFCYLCCGNRRGCGTYLLILNGISALFGIALVVLTALFVDNPCRCFDALCRLPNWDYIDEIDDIFSRRYSCTERTRKKLPILKALLACAIAILVLNLVFILTYLIVSIRLRARKRSRRSIPEVNYQSQRPFVDWSRLSSYDPANRTDLSYQHQQSYALQTIHRPNQWPSAPAADHIYSQKF